MRRVRIAAFLMAGMLLLSGCTIGGRRLYFSFTTPGVVFTIGPLSCHRSEVQLYLVNYRNLYGYVGQTDLWNGTFDNDKLEDGLKMAVINHLSQVYSLNLYARDHDMSLNEPEESRIAQAAKEYYESLSEAEKEYLAMSQHDIRACYERYALAEKVNSALMSMVDDEVSEDEARVMDAYVLYTRDRAVSEEVERQIRSGASFDRLAATYSEGDKGVVSFGRGTYPEAVETAAFALEDGEVSEGIEADGGFYFIECIDKYNEALSDENKATIIAKRQSSVIDDIISEQRENDISQINLALWEKLKLDDGEEIRTDSFFSVLESYLRY